ncbi:MAG: glycosyltransferase [Candidatus Bathyarchaeia archaeon]
MKLTGQKYKVNSGRPKVLFLHQGGELYGSDIVFLQVIKALSSDVEPIIVLDNHGPLIEELQTICSNIIIQKLGVLRRKHFNLHGILQCIYHIVRSALWLVKLIKRENISLVYSNTIGVLPGAFAAKITGVAHIWHIHEIIISPKGVSNLLTWLVLTLSTKVIAVSNAVAARLSQGVQSKRKMISVIYNGVAVEPFDSAHGDSVRSEFGANQSVVLIGVIGRIHYWKGQDYFLDVAYLMKKMDFNDFKVLIVGAPFKGYEYLIDELITKTQKLGLVENIIFCGYRKDIPDILKAVDIVVVPSTQPDPFPMVVLEAMAACKPVVATAHGGPVEMIVDGYTGFLVPLDSPQIMAERLLQLAKNPQLRESMGKHGRKRVEDLFSIRRFNDDIRRVVLGKLRGDF